MSSFVGILLFCFGAVFLICYLLFLFLFYRYPTKVEQDKFQNTYPYQFYASLPSTMKKVVLYIVFAFSILFLVFGSFTFFLSLSTVYNILIGIAFSLSILFLGLSNITSLSYYKRHILFALLAIGFYSLACLMYSFRSIVDPIIGQEGYSTVPIDIIIGIFGGLFLFSLFNPGLLNWAKMDKTEVDGTTYYVKPKINYLALEEWILLVMQLITGALYLLNYGISLL